MGSKLGSRGPFWGSSTPQRAPIAFRGSTSPFWGCQGFNWGGGGPKAPPLLLEAPLPQTQNFWGSRGFPGGPQSSWGSHKPLPGGLTAFTGGGSPQISPMGGSPPPQKINQTPFYLGGGSRGPWGPPKNIPETPKRGKKNPKLGGEKPPGPSPW